MDINTLNTQSSPESKKRLADSVFESLSDYFFNKVVYVYHAYSDNDDGTDPNSQGTVDSNYFRNSRIIDSSSGMNMSNGKVSRFRCLFYLKNPNKLDGYLLTPAVFDGINLPNPLTNLSSFRSYVGLRFIEGQTYVVVKQVGKDEKIVNIDFRLGMQSSTFTNTYLLEIQHNITHTDIFINKKLMASVESDMVGNLSTSTVFYPFFGPAKSTDATRVNLVAEHIQFLQNK